jgi:protein-tyrosine phosphatase
MLYVAAYCMNTLQALTFVKHAESLDGRVLVHCVAGCSRSAAIVLLHLMAAHGKQRTATFRH